MKTESIVFGAIFVIILSLMTPSISALKFQLVKQEHQNQFIRDAAETVVDIPLFLSIVNFIIMRLIAGFQFTKQGMFFSAYYLVYLLLFIRIFQQELATGQTIPRYTAYQTYFISLFSIFSSVLAKKIKGTASNLVLTVAALAVFIGTYFCKYLGNMLYVLLGRPSEPIIG